MHIVSFCSLSRRLVALKNWNSIYKIQLRKLSNTFGLNLTTTNHLQNTGTALSFHSSAKLRDTRPDKTVKVDDDIHRAIAGSKPVVRKPWVGYNPFKEAASADWISYLSQEVDWETYIEDKVAERQMNKLQAMQQYLAERRKHLGGDLAAARFIVAMNGKVKLKGDDHWYSRERAAVKSLPTEKTPGLVVEAADLSETLLIYEGVENLFQAESMLYLSFSKCCRLDEWSISRLAMIPSLVSLDLSHNSYITERCLIPLQHIPNLQKLDLTGIKYFTDQPLPLVFLEELLPNCVITTG